VDRTASGTYSQLAWALSLILEAPRQARLPFRPISAIEADQRRRLANTVSHAYRHVPYYRKSMARLGLAPGDIATADDLARLPLLRREDVQRDPERFVSGGQPIERYSRKQTGGSTGEPLTVYYDSFSLIQAAAHHQRAGSLHRRMVRRQFGFRMLVIGHQANETRRPVEETLARVRKLAGGEVRRASILEPVERTLEVIDSFHPHVVFSHGSYLEAIFVHLRRSGRQSHLPRLVLYGGDAMSTGARTLISDEFGIPVLSMYGAYEALSLGFECDAHLGFHLNVDLYPVRIIDDAGRELPDGESGEVVISNLVNRGTMLLNYRLGDVARKLPARCPCGRSLPLLSFLEGRLDDWVMTAGGERMHPQGIRTLFSDEEEVRRYQVVQRSPRQFDVTLMEAPGCDRKRLAARLAAKFSGRLGEGTRIEVSFVDTLPHTARGKIRTVIGLQGGPPGEAGTRASR
jgi:phenylacetate-CoA ligase